MRIPPFIMPVVLIAASARLANGFVAPHHSSLSNILSSQQRHYTSIVLFQSSNQDTTTDNYDDWYADFDPSDYEDVNDRASGISHDYKRDLQADASNVNQVEIDALISERLEYRKTGRFQEADTIRNELLEKHGVAIFDREKVWRSGCSMGGSGQKWRPNQPQQRQQRGGRGRKRNFGPNGHDYNLSPYAGPNSSTLDQEEIHALLAERLECKMNRNFRDADAIQDELIQAGVYVHDGNKEWRADGRGFGDVRGQGGRPGREFGSRNDRNRPYTQAKQSLPTDDAEEIQALVEERMEAKKFRDYRVADDIRDELRQEFNVEVNDRLRSWSVGGDFGIPQRDSKYTMSQESELPDNSDEIQQMVEERNEARKVRDFDTADSIRDELLDQNVMVDDKLRQWAVGGRFSANNRRNEAGAPSFNTPFIKRGAGGDLTDEQVVLIEQLLQERSAAKRDKQFGKADRIRDRLQADFKVRVDDRAREWHVVSDKYAMNPVVSGMDESIRALIEERIVERSVAKLERDYETADAIRDELAKVYNVDIDDRVREWTVIGAPMAVDDDSVFDVDESDFESDDSWDEEEVDESEEIDEDREEAESPADELVVEAIEAEDLTALTIPELKVRLKEAGLPVSGRKAELIERLTN